MREGGRAKEKNTAYQKILTEEEKRRRAVRKNLKEHSGYRTQTGGRSGEQRSS